MLLIFPLSNGLFKHPEPLFIVALGAPTVIGLDGSTALKKSVASVGASKVHIMHGNHRESMIYNRPFECTFMMVFCFYNLLIL